MADKVCAPVRSVVAPLDKALRHAAGTTPSSRAGSVLAAAHQEGIPSATARRWASTQRHDPQLAAFASSPLAWHQIDASARALVASSSTAAGRAATRAEVALRLVGRLLKPVEMTGGLTAKRLTTARFALALIGVEHLRGALSGGFQGGLVVMDELATRMGVGRQAAQSAVRALETMGWLTATKRRPGSAARMKRAPLPVSVKASTLGHHLGLVELVADPGLVDRLDDLDLDPETADLLAALPDDRRALDLLLSVEHPAWSYSRPKGERTGLTGRHWLVAFADQAGADPVALGVPDRTAKTLRRELDRAKVGPLYDSTLADQLDRVAWTTGALDRHREAWAVRSQQKKDRAAARAQAVADLKAKRAAPKARTAAQPAPVAQRITVRVPDGFDPERHADRLLAKVTATGHGTGWTIETVVDRQATLIRSTAA